MTAFVLGNGVSRNMVAVPRLMELGAVYGCNAIYRQHEVNVLVSTDQPISQAIQESGYSKNHRFYTRRPLPNSGAQLLIKKYHGFSSGPNAVAIAAQDYQSPVYLLGFDMGPDSAGTFNNVYAGTQFYKDVGAHPTYTGNWTKQLITVMTDYPKTQFIRVYGDTTATVPDFGRVANLDHMSMTTFLDRINTQKDL
jgi:hypothetical protein